MKTSLPPLRYASVPARLTAGFVDLVFGALVAAGLTALFLYGARQPLLISGAIAVALVVVGRGLMLATTGWSLGGRLLGVRFLSAQNRQPSLVGVFLHADITFVVTFLTLGLGGIALMRSVAKDPHKRGWHDRRSGIMVVSTRGARAAQTPAEEQAEAEIAASLEADASAPAAASPLVVSPDLALEQDDAAVNDDVVAAEPEPDDVAVDPVASEPVASEFACAGDDVVEDSLATPEPLLADLSPAQAPTGAQPAEENWPTLTQPVPAQALSPAQASLVSGAPTTRTPEDPSRHLSAADSPRKTGRIGKFGRKRSARRGAKPTTPALDSQETPASWDAPRHPGKIHLNPVTSQPMEARPAKEQPWQPRSEQASSPAAQPQGRVPERESLFETERYSFTGNSAPQGDVARTFDTTSVLPSADRNTQALIDSVPWSAVPTSLDATTMDNLPDLIRKSMQADAHKAAQQPASQSTQTSQPVQPAAQASQTRARSVNLLDPQQVPGAATQPASQPEANAWERLNTPAAPAGSPTQQHSTAPQHSAPPTTSAAPQTPAASTVSSASGPYVASHAASPPSATAAPITSPTPVTRRATRLARNAADPAADPAATVPEQAPTGAAVRTPAPPTLEVPRVTRRRRTEADQSAQPTVAPPQMPTSHATASSVTVRLAPLAGGEPLLIHDATVVGRDPDNISKYAGAKRVALSDPARTVSKTHAAIFPMLDGVLVTDLHSTNGTRVDNKDGSSITATPEQQISVLYGATVYFGRIGFRVEEVR